jgi:cytoskeletal protein CcmA (bactofilin family)
MSFFGNRRQAEPPEIHSSIEKTELPKTPVSQRPVGFETVLGANSVMEGVLRSQANVRLDGTFTGTLEISGNVLVGESAKIHADINAKNISIAGAVRGNVSGKKVQLLRTGRIWGDIHATALTTEEGAFIDGKITMVSHEAQAATSSFESEDGQPELKLPSFLSEESEFEDDSNDTQVSLSASSPDQNPISTPESNKTQNAEPSDDTDTDATI